jgi:stress response protein YsnF
MENFSPIIEAVSTLGFPIVAVAVLAWFIYRIYTDTTKRNAEQIELLEEKSKEREERLYEQLEKQNEINGKAIATISLYAEKLDVIQDDVKEIKSAILGK